MTKPHMAIIGGGASAVLLLANLARLPNIRGVDVDVYDRAGKFGRGIAYSTIHDVHLLNVRAANMSAFQDDKDDFAIWAKEHGYQPADFVPRKKYALYLRDKLDQACKILNVKFIESDVTRSEKKPDGYRISTASSNADYTHVFLATGNVRPLRPKVKEPVLGYHDDPWTMDFDEVLTKKNIALIGSGLSAVDVIVALQSRDYKGKISVYSRNGLFPLPHAEPVSYHDFLNDGDEKNTVASLLRKIRAEAKKANEKNVPWQSVIDALRAHTNAIWQAWNCDEKSKFMKRFLTFWNIHRHRMAPQIDAILQSMISNGYVSVVRRRVEAVADGPCVVSAPENIAYDAIINCLGYRYDEDGREYQVSERIGPARFGDLFETTAIPEIRAQAADIAATIKI